MKDLQNYKFISSKRADRCRLIFPDGVEYTLREAVLIANTEEDSEIPMLHFVKKFFDGEIQSVTLRHPKKYPEGNTRLYREIFQKGE